MSKIISRRNFLVSSASLTVAAGTKHVLGDEHKTRREFYEWRVYKTIDADKKRIIDTYLKNALIPAMNRMGIDRIGVFSNLEDDKDPSLYLLIPYPTLDTFARVNSNLQADTQYLNAAKEYFAVDMDNPLFNRIQSRFYKAFKEMPVIEMPEQTKGNKQRIFELRIYESHTEEKAALKVDMFNSGETQIMRETGLAPVFYGEALIGDDLPNLTYMLSASDSEAHKAHWQKFRVHPEWERMKNMPKYKDTVSNITKIFLKPTPYSQI